MVNQAHPLSRPLDEPYEGPVIVLLSTPTRREVPWAFGPFEDSEAAIAFAFEHEREGEVDAMIVPIHAPSSEA